ncbi:hypothetical protein PVK06_011547 [Gossypium arboreum]|uniref:RNase H type-1 domain-containing protein n=1 Tax=Gossypium arboreum TaxID=29729 RepID=A0ABR0Q9M0_GOSAR|nr:hypothetical protein PVK06_011547 [Gossypium arboreum]
MAIKLDLEKAYDRVDQARLLDSILSQFCRISRHKISVRKSSIFFSKYIGVDVRNQISQLIGFQEVQNLGTYLGVPFLHDRVSKNTLNFVVDKIRRKLQSWDARKLSFAGRITLGQSVLLSIPNYFMQSLMIPKGVCADIERLVRQFIWGCTEGQFKMALVGWDAICQPRARGGLGFRHLNDQNSSFLMKIGFSLNLDLFRVWVSEEVISRITSIPPPHPDFGSDRVEIRETLKRSIGRFVGSIKNLSELEFFFGRPFSKDFLLILYELDEELVTLVSVPFVGMIWKIWYGSWVYLSTDGAVSRDFGYAATGGVCSPFEAEVWGILDGILILLNKGFRRIIILIYNLEVAQNLSALNLEDLGIVVFRRTQRVMQSEGEWKIEHIPRNLNLVADSLAKLSLNWKSNLQIIVEALKEILDLLQADKANGYFM